jgi:predicted small secreted protein
MFRKILLILTLIVVIFSFVGCQTVQGIGGDIKSIGEAGEEILQGL